MKKLIVLISVAFIILNANAQNTDNFCDPELKSKIDNISKIGGVNLKEFLISNDKAGEFHQKFTMLLSRGNIYRFYLLSSSKIPCETILSLFGESNVLEPLKVIKQKSNDPVAFEDVEIIRTGPYNIDVTFKDNTKGCAMVMLNFISTKSSNIQNDKVDTSIVYNEVEVNAKFNGGDLNQFRNYIAQNFKVDTALTKGVTGKIFILFVVNTEGKVERAKILRSCGVPQFDKQAFKVVMASPRWLPALIKATAVKQAFVLPILIK
jgi:TonB family protein